MTQESQNSAERNLSGDQRQLLLNHSSVSCDNHLHQAARLRQEAHDRRLLFASKVKVAKLSRRLAYSRCKARQPYKMCAVINGVSHDVYNVLSSIWIFRDVSTYLEEFLSVFHCSGAFLGVSIESRLRLSSTRHIRSRQHSVLVQVRVQVCYPSRSACFCSVISKPGAVGPN